MKTRNNNIERREITVCTGIGLDGLQLEYHTMVFNVLVTHHTPPHVHKSERKQHVYKSISKSAKNKRDKL